MKKIIILLYFLFAVFSLSTNGQNDGAKYRENPSLAKKDAELLFQEGGYSQVVKLCRLYYNLTGDTTLQSLLKKASSCKAFNDSANTLFSNKEYDAALAAYKSILEINPQDPIVKKRIAEIQIIIDQTKPTNASSIASKSESSQSSSSPKIIIKLVAESNGKQLYYSTSEWNKLAVEEKVKLKKIGIQIGQGASAFILSLYNNMGRGICSKTVSYKEAFEKTGGQLPTKVQLQTIKKNITKISDALNAFGGDHICSAFYWCQDGTYLNLGSSSNTSFNKEAMFRITTTNIESGFDEVPALNDEANEYDYMGGIIDEWEKGKGYLQIVGARGKYGLINEDGKIVVPLRFDDMDGGIAPTTNNSSNTHNSWSGKGLMSVCINSNWGYINRDGAIVVPTMFDKVDSRCLDYAAVQKEKLFGFIDNNGESILPIELSEVEFDYPHKKRFYAKKDGKYGFLDKNFKLVIPYKYDFVTGFSQQEDLCGVGNNGKYGYIDGNGTEVIPLAFDFAEEFYHGLAAIVKDKKLGFVNTKGEIVCSPQFYVCYISIYYQYGILTSCRTAVEYGLASSFRYSPYIAFVSKDTNYNYGIINRDGTLISPFKYSRVIEGSSLGFTAELDGERVYLDIAGNEYRSKEEREQKSDYLLATQGYPEGQFRYGKSIIDSNNDEGMEWILKAAQQNYVSAIIYLAEDSQRKKDFSSAYDWYVKASDLGDKQIALQLGDLCYDNNSIHDANKKALDWYQRYLSYQLDLNDSYCLNRIGLIYYYGEHGVPKSYKKAYEFFNESLSETACYFLGWMYEHGQYVNKDIDKAIEWYKKSNGKRDSAQRIEQLATQITN